MIDIFMRDPLPNTLAVIVLIALVTTWVTAIVLNLRSEPVSIETGWYPKLLPLITLTGLPAVWDLLQTTDIAWLFAVIALIVFALNIIVPLVRISGRSSHPIVNEWYRWSVLASVVGGLAITIYLTFIESTGGPVSCGVSQGCDNVLDSRYALLFGLLPMGMLGLMGYLTILIGWLVWQFGPAYWKRYALLSTWALCMFGVLFSIYLTFLEPFVIGATCMWCICSAVLMMGLLLAVIPPAQEAFVITEPE